MKSDLAMARRVDLTDGPIRYTDIGEGKPIVFVHGVFVNGNLWRKVTGPLSSQFRCIAPDWPFGSHSEPMRDDADLSTPGLARIVAEFLESLDLDDVTLVGNDTGGAVCQLVVADHRERIGRLVLTSCDAFEVFPPSPFGFLLKIPTLPGAAFGLAQSLRFRPVLKLPIAYGWVMTRLPERDVVKSYTDPLLDPAIRRDAVKLLRGVAPEHLLDAPERFRDFERPVLLAWGAEDKLFPITLAERLANVFPDARVELVPGARTFVAEDNPEYLARLITDFAGT